MSAAVETTPDSSDPSRMWAAVGGYLEAFARAWEAPGAPPDPAAFLPAGPPHLRALVLVELIKLDLDHRLGRGLDRAVEDYVAAFPELAETGPPADLLYEDYHLRRQAGRPADPGDYFRRFPARAADLARLVGATVPARSTSVHIARAPVGLAPGDRLDDFDLLALLGEGQFARVFLARQRSMQRLVALKVSARGAAEAQTLAQLDHPHIVRVYDQRTEPGRGLHLVYMPYLAGGTLQDVVARVRSEAPAQRSGRTLLAAVDAALDRRGEIAPAASAARQAWAARTWGATVCAVGARLASALDYAHRHGVLHRDVKPANVLLTAEGEPLLADFNVGCCSKLDGAGPAAFFGGSLAYMSPEHLEAFNPAHPRPAESLDGRADVYGLAVTLWELATGTRPFPDEAVPGDWPATLAALVARRHAGPPAEAVAALPADVPGLRELLLRCLEADPDRRPATAGELARELELCLRPATHDLVRPAPGGWRAAVRRHPVAAVFSIGLAPNIAASLFNIWYNNAAIINDWPAARADFDRIIPAVNGVFFPLGLLMLFLALRPVATALRGLGRGESFTPADLAARRRRALRLGGTAALICIGCWAIAGLIWPVVLEAAAGPPPQGSGAHFHFLVSLVFCGLTAAAYPYFLVTVLAVRVFYPALLGPGGPDADDGPALGRVGRELGWYRAAAVAVPLLAVALLALTNPERSQAPVVVLSAAGLAGLGVAFVLEARIRADLAALADLPAGPGT
ncbi:serine/threonine protein kinase [bacterium]|nr:serine/threonine protein kinase [bacterium]